MLKADFTFRGCSCGCTPYEHCVIQSETEEGLAKGIARRMNDFRTYGTPYHKNNWKLMQGLGPEFEGQVKEHCDKLRAAEQEQWDLERKVWNSWPDESEKQYTPIFLTNDPEQHPLTSEQMEANYQEKLKFEEYKTGLKKRIDELRSIVFQYEEAAAGWSLEEDEDEDD